MDFALSTEQAALADSIARFCGSEYGMTARQKIIASAAGYSRAHWETFANLGWLGAGLPEAVGGYGGGAIDTAIIMEGFGRALVVEPYVASAVLAAQILLALPGGSARADMIAGIIDGTAIVAVAHNEPAAHGDVNHVTSRADQVEGAWLISGHKSLCLAAPIASHLLVSARHEDGVGLFLVAAGAAGMRLQPYRTLDNMRVADVWLNQTAAEEVLAVPGQALSAIRKGTDHAIAAITAEAVGAMDAALTLTLDYVKMRTQFGARLSSFQALQHRLADMFVELEMSRSILYQGLAALEADEADRARAVSAMKVIVSSAALFLGRNAIQLHGAIGMTEEYAIGHYYRRLLVIASQFGGESFHLRRLASTHAPTKPNNRESTNEGGAYMSASPIPPSSYSK